jgi:hypothetical protein
VAGKHLAQKATVLPLHQSEQKSSEV